MAEIKTTTEKKPSTVENIESDFSDIDPENTIDITNRETDTTLFQRSLMEDCITLAKIIYNKWKK